MIEIAVATKWCNPCFKLEFFCEVPIKKFQFNML